VQRSRQFFDDQDRRNPLATLQQADVVSVQSGVRGEGLLRKPGRFASAAKYLPKALLNWLHGCLGRKQPLHSIVCITVYTQQSCTQLCSCSERGKIAGRVGYGRVRRATGHAAGINQNSQNFNAGHDMAEQWFYSTGGTKHGPVPSKQLVALARGGKLSPTDLVWKEGMAEWKPAGKVKGLFPTNPATPPPLPTPAPSAKPPDLAAAAKGLFGAVAAAAQQAVAKATEATKPVPGSSLQAARLPLAGRQKKGLLVVGAVVSVCVVALAVAAVAGLPFGKAKGTGTPGEVAANPNREDQPVTTVADAEKKAKAEATQLLPAAGELVAHVEQLQADLAEFRKSSGGEHWESFELQRSGLYEVNLHLRESAEQYDLQHLGKVLDDVTRQRVEKADKVRDPVVQFLDAKAKLETGLRKLIADNGGAKGHGIHTEHARKELADFKKKGPPEVEVFTVEQIAKKWQAARQKAYDELKGNAFELQRLKKMHADEDRTEAMSSVARRKFALEEYEERLKTLEKNLAEAERKEGEEVKTANAVRVAAAKKQLQRLEITDSEEMRKAWSQATQRYGEVLGAVRQMRERVEKLRPVPPNDLLRELEVVSGITHLIEDDLYYIENKVVRIPAKYPRSTFMIGSRRTRRRSRTTSDSRATRRARTDSGQPSRSRCTSATNGTRRYCCVRGSSASRRDRF
jgi:GYF domain 2